MSDNEGPQLGLGRRLGWLRSQRGLTQQDLARRLGLTQSAVSRIESGDRRLSAAQLIRCAEILGVDLATLAGPEGAKMEEAQIGAGESHTQALPAQYAAALPSDAAQGVREGGGVRRDVEDESPPATRVPSAEIPSSAIPPAAPRSPDETKATSRRSVIPGPVGHADDRLLLRQAFSESAPDTPAGETGGVEGHPGALGFAAIGPSAAERRRVVRTLAVEPPVFSEVVADALGLEELAAQHGLPPATHVSWADRRLLGPPSPEPARAARFWRHELGIGVEGPLPDLVMLLEEAGVLVVHARLDEQIPAGACTEVSAPRLPRSSSQTRDSASTAASVLPFIFVNGARPVMLQRFALAHEFAHLALGHRDAYDERIDWSGRSGREVSANTFAEEFTAPTAAVRRWLEARGEPEIDVALVVDLANHFGISFWAARYRLRAAGRLPTRRLRELDDSLRRREWELIPRQIFLGGLRDALSVLAAESRDDAERGANLLRMAPREVRVPGRMRTVTLSLLERGVLSLEQAAAILRFDVASLREQLARLGL